MSHPEAQHASQADKPLRIYENGMTRARPPNHLRFGIIMLFCDKFPFISPIKMLTIIPESSETHRAPEGAANALRRAR